ncbi:MAG TPA: hypothetical protein VHS27_10915 [Gaiellales bacterium]|nr:hypothetical protein [Gaiellales bacterium]
MSAAFDVAGGGGDGPELLAARAIADQITRPGGSDVVLRWFVVAGKARQDEPTGVWVRMLAPGGSETAAAAAVAGLVDDGPIEVALGAFRSSDELGEYVAAVSLVDTKGNVSEAFETKVELVGDGGVAGPSIAEFSPSSAHAGDEIVVSGRGLDPDDLGVEVAGVAAAILSAEGETMRIRMPDVNRPGQIVVSSRMGAGVSEGELAPQVAVRVVPDVISVPEGASVQLTAVVNGATDGRVEWAVQARAGEPGTISPDGVYTPPLGRGKGAITVTAVSSADPSASGDARVRVVPHPSARGPLPLGPLGGTVRSGDDRCVLVVPRNALAELTTIGIEPVAVDPADAPDGQVVVAAAQITGGPLEAAGELTLPLTIPLDPGTQVGLQVRDDLGDPWQDVPDFGIVIPGREALRLRLESLPNYVRATLHYSPSPPSFLPTIQSVTPWALNEGETAAVLVAGTNFVPGVTSVSILKQSGGIEPRVDVRQIHVTGDGKNLGVTLKAGVMIDLAEGQTRYLSLRVTTPAGSADRSLAILGHDEIDTGAGTVSVAQSTTFSTIRVGPGGTLRVAHTQPPVTVAAYETIVVGGGLPGQGRGLVQVASGNGAPGTPGSTGGAGGAGGSPAPFVIGAGGAGGPGGTTTTTMTSGNAGAAGATMFGGGPRAGGGGGLAGVFVGSDGFNGSSAPSTVVTPNLILSPPLEARGGGGGGGGGGWKGPVLPATGGGGGGGGSGGGGLELAAGEEIRVRGRVAANGGDGGDGAFPWPVGNPPSAPPFHPGCGGGGGGGTGGTVYLRGLRLLDGEVLAVGGMSGRAARFSDAVIVLPGALSELQRLLANPHSGGIQVDGSVSSGGMVAPDPFLAPDLDYLPELVTGDPQIQISGTNTDAIRVRSASGEQWVRPTTGPSFTAMVPLAPGYNEIAAFDAIGSGTADDPFLPATVPHPLRMRRVLFLQGAAAGFGFLCTISPPTPTVATERTIQLTATVTGTTLTAVVWSVDGGASNGVVDQHGIYRAPCTPPAGPVTVRATSAFDPTKSGTATVTVIPGIALTAQPTAGTPADPAAPSANVGQAITIAIPAPTHAVTNQDFSPGQGTEFQTVQRDPATGQCTSGSTAVGGTVLAGMTSMHVAVPPCAAPDQAVKVAGHGCARLQVVPRITGLDRSTSLGQSMAINGSGFACGATSVYFGATKVVDAQILSVTCNVILVGIRPGQGVQVKVTTAGGTSNAVT